MIDRNHPAVESLARELAQLDAGDPWPSNEELGGHHILGTRDDEYHFAMLEEAREALTDPINPQHYKDRHPGFPKEYIAYARPLPYAQGARIQVRLARRPKGCTAPRVGQVRLVP